MLHSRRAPAATLIVTAPPAPPVRSALGMDAEDDEAPRVGPGAGAPVLAYISLSNADRQLDVPGLVEQEVLIRERCVREGWRLMGVLCDEPRTLDESRGRPALDAVLERIADGEADCVLVSQLDRLGRSAVELGAAMQRLSDLEATVVSLDYTLDTSSTPGGLVTDVLIGVAAWERDRIAAGTRSGHALARAEGRPISRPSVTDRPALQQRILAMREDGMTLQAIADTLNDEGVPTVRGGALWRPSSVQVAAGYKRPRSSGNGRRARKPDANGKP
jgi:DNA invertase Pin-like site-specific DNA recombinase